MSVDICCGKADSVYELYMKVTGGTYTRGKIHEPLARLRSHIYPICRSDEFRVEGCAIREQTVICITLERLHIDVVVGLGRHDDRKQVVGYESGYPLDSVQLFITHQPSGNYHYFPPNHPSSSAQLDRERMLRSGSRRR